MKTRLIELPELTDISSREAINKIIPNASYGTLFIHDDVLCQVEFWKREEPKEDEELCKQYHYMTKDALPESHKVTDVSEYEQKIEELAKQTIYLNEKLEFLQSEADKKLPQDLFLQAIAAANGKILK